MEMTPVKRKENTTMDLIKFFFCTLVATAHLPSIYPDEVFRAYVIEWSLRSIVPFFFLCSGYFFAKARNKLRSLQRVGWLFLLANVLYLPPMLQGAADLSGVLSKLRWNLLFGYEHLWYVSAVAEGMLIWYVLEKLPGVNKLFRKFAVPVCFLLFLVGAVTDEYFLILEPGSPIRLVGDILARFGGPRNVVFMGFPLLIFGGAIARNEERIAKIPLWALLVAWVVLRALAFWECEFLFAHRGIHISNDITFFGWWPAVILFCLTMKVQIPIPGKLSLLLRKMSEYVYILHPMAATWISQHFVLEPFPLWISTIALCAAVYVLLEKQFVVKK